MRPSVVDDQYGRLTFTAELARGIRHLLDTQAPYGTYNLSSSGPTRSWADIAAEVFALRGRDPGDITRVSTAAYAEGKQLAPRPMHSTLRLDKISAAGFAPEASTPALQRYLAAAG